MHDTYLHRLHARYILAYECMHDTYLHMNACTIGRKERIAEELVGEDWVDQAPNLVEAPHNR